MHDAIIIGGGVIGLSTARELALQGRSVLILDRGNPAEAASWAAAGMIAPQSEAAEPDPLFDLCSASARAYPAWITQLREESGVDPQFAKTGSLFVASTEDGLKRLACMVEWQSRAGLSASLISAEQALRLEPQITLTITGAAVLPDEAQVTPRALVAALRASCAARGVETRTDHEVVEVEREDGRVSAVRTSRGRFSADIVVVAAGVQSAGIRGLEPGLPLAPRKGQILSLASPAPRFERMIRWEHAYFVPRPSGELVIGATNEDAGFDRSLTPAGVGGLLQRAQELSTHTGGAPIHEMWTGLRPAAPDGLPIIGRTHVEGLLYAAGHYRNGVLLAPITAACIAALAANTALPAQLDAFSPLRFRAV